MTTRSIAVPAIRQRAIDILAEDGGAIRDAVRQACDETDPPLNYTEADFIATLLTAALDRYETCVQCGGGLIGAERAFGSCGHCGGRSRRP